jgi:hypothetical protein
LVLVFLFPVGAYCLLLAMFNRRAHPFLVSGPWDCVGLLFAASGVLLFDGPIILSTLYHRFVGGLLLDDNWWAVLLSYYVLVVVGAVLLLRSRRDKTVVYNVEASVFAEVLNRVFDRLGLESRRQGNRILLALGAPVAPLAPDAGPNREAFLADVPPFQHTGGGLTAFPADAQAVLDVETFASLYHVTLHWRSHRGLVREEVEVELSRQLDAVVTHDNPAGNWFLSIAGCLFFAILFGVAVSILSNVLIARR